MALAVRLNRITWAVVIFAGLLVVAASLTPVARFVVAKMEEQSDRPRYRAADDVVVLPNGTTMLIEHGSPTSRTLDWLNQWTGSAQTIELGNADFASGSAAFTREGWERLVEQAHILKAYRDLTILILFCAHHDDASTLKLERARAYGIRDELLKQGVDEQQVSVAQESFEPDEDPTQSEGLNVVLVQRPRKTG